MFKIHVCYIYIYVCDVILVAHFLVTCDLHIYSCPQDFHGLKDAGKAWREMSPGEKAPRKIKATEAGKAPACLLGTSSRRLDLELPAVIGIRAF